MFFYWFTDGTCCCVNTDINECLFNISYLILLLIVSASSTCAWFYWFLMKRLNYWLPIWAQLVLNKTQRMNWLSNEWTNKNSQYTLLNEDKDRHINFFNFKVTLQYPYSTPTVPLENAMIIFFQSSDTNFPCGKT